MIKGRPFRWLFGASLVAVMALGVGLALFGSSYWLAKDRIEQAVDCSGISRDRLNAMVAELQDRGGESPEEAREDAIALVCPRLSH